tara:strand:+ start:69 stop:584 length:516 start_codon:yes stop_codon:yes gene_type:complete
MGIRLSVRSLLPLLMLLQACDGTPFGQKLSESFDAQSADVRPVLPKSDQPDKANVLEVPVKSERTEQQAQIIPKANPKANNDEDGNASVPERAQPQSPDVATARPAPRAAPERTLPYRIMIRLSAADPAAPAEGVTEALRRAGIGFEVETIEKVPVSELNQPSTVQPKPAS